MQHRLRDKTAAVALSGHSVKDSKRCVWEDYIDPFAHKNRCDQLNLIVHTFRVYVQCFYEANGGAEQTTGFHSVPQNVDSVDVRASSFNRVQRPIEATLQKVQSESDHAQSDPSLHSVIAAIPTTIQPMPPFEDTESTFRSGPPRLRLSEPSLLL